MACYAAPSNQHLGHHHRDHYRYQGTYRRCHGSSCVFDMGHERGLAVFCQDSAFGPIRCGTTNLLSRKVLVPLRGECGGCQVPGMHSTVNTSNATRVGDARIGQAFPHTCSRSGHLQPATSNELRRLTDRDTTSLFTRCVARRRQANIPHDQSRFRSFLSVTKELFSRGLFSYSTTFSCSPSFIPSLSVVPRRVHPRRVLRLPRPLPIILRARHSAPPSTRVTTRPSRVLGSGA